MAEANLSRPSARCSFALLFAAYIAVIGGSAEAAGARPSSEARVLRRIQARQPVSIVLVGDSTVAAGGGWGPGFCARLAPNVTCIDTAMNGRSTKTFLAEGHWRASLRAGGSLYLIQFGHNDQKPMPALHADAATTYAVNLRRFIADVRGIGGIPILLSPLSRRTYKDGKPVEDGLAAYGAAAQRVAAEENVRFLDLLALSRAYLATLTQAQADRLDAAAPVTGHEAATKPDRTHLNDAGKCLFGRMVAVGLVRVEPAFASAFDTAPRPCSTGH